MNKKMSKRNFLLLVSAGLPLAGAPGACRALRDRLPFEYMPSLPLPPSGIVVHHSATKPSMQPYTDAASIDKMHKERGMGAWHMGEVYHVAYHYVILHNGEVQKGRPETCRGAHTTSLFHNRWIGICLIGYFDTKWTDPGYHVPTPEQMKSLVSLSGELAERWSINPANILPHREINSTRCPGNNFPMKEYLARLKKGKAGYAAKKAGRCEGV